MYSIEFEVPLVYTDPNRLSGRDWRTRHSRFERVKNSVAMAIKGQAPRQPLKKFKLRFTRLGPGFLDWDNLVASLKPYIDGLTLAGIIHDDNWTYIRSIEVDQKKVKEDSRLIIQVTEISKRVCKSHMISNTKEIISNAV